jgi:hypothetical protein
VFLREDAVPVEEDSNTTGTVPPPAFARVRSSVDLQELASSLLRLVLALLVVLDLKSLSTTLPLKATTTSSVPTVNELAPSVDPTDTNVSTSRALSTLVCTAHYNLESNSFTDIALLFLLFFLSLRRRMPWRSYSRQLLDSSWSCRCDLP